MLWKHVKTGTIYSVNHPVALIEKDLRPAIIYAAHPGGNSDKYSSGMALPGPFFVRPADEFLDGRFVMLTEKETNEHLTPR